MNINHESEERFTPDDHEDLDMVQPRSARRIDTNFHFWKLVLSLQYLLHHNWLDFQFVLNTRLLYRMFVPFFSKRSERSLVRRKGGGGKGAGGGGKSGSGGGTGAGRSSPISSSGSSKSATSYGAGGGKVTTIPSGQLFAGRTSGGGTRSEVFGNRYVVLRQCLYSLLIFFFFHFQAVWKWLPRNCRKRCGWTWISIPILAPGLGRRGWRWDRGLSAQHRGQ